MSRRMVEFPSSERVSIIGGLSQGEALWSVVALGLFLGTLFTRLWWGLVVVGVVLVWAFAPNRRAPFRVRVPAVGRWVVRRDKVWSAPLTGTATGSAPFLARTEVLLTHDVSTGAPVGVVRDRAGVWTAVFGVERPSLAFGSEVEQAEAFGAWAEVLGGTCVERGMELAPSMVGWTDVHRAADPTELVRVHTERGVVGPASEDYAAYVDQFGTVASEHEVFVWVSLARRDHLRTARRAGFVGSVDEVMGAATVAVARSVAAGLSQRGFTTGELLSPAQISRLIGSTLDPWRGEREMSHRERAGLAEPFTPRQVTVSRSSVAVDHAFHRCFSVEFPRTGVDPAWLWRPLGIDGPKITTAVFVPVPPSRADMQREAFTTRGLANNRAAFGSSRGRVREKDRRKVEALARAEVAVAEGHHELDGYLLVVLTARSDDELERRGHQLRQRLRETGRAQAHDLPGLHDTALAAALPIGRRAVRSVT